MDSGKWLMIAVVVLFVLIMALAVWSDENQCSEVGKIMQVETYYSHAAGCFIEVEEGQWIPLESYKYSSPE